MQNRDLPPRPGEPGSDVGKKGGAPVESPNVEGPTDTPKKPGGEVKVPNA